MSKLMSDNPYHTPLGNWTKNKLGRDMYQLPTTCPYCGERKRDEIVRYEGVWFRLRCKECGEDYKVRCRAR